MGDRELVSRPEPPHLHALAVDPDAVGAPQVAHHQLVFVLRHAAVMTGDTQRIEPGIALGMAADDHHGAIQGDVGSVVDGHQA